MWLALLALAAGLFLGRQRLARWLLPAPTPRAAKLQPAAQAQQRYAAGLQAYAIKRYPAAMAAFEEALRLDPDLAGAHRALGILFAREHAASRALWHYQRYVRLAPQAPDAAAVRELIVQYQKNAP